MTHTLKIAPNYYADVVSGDKTFEVRKNDRPFKVGDIIILQEYDIETKKYSGREADFTITYKLDGDFNKFGLASDYCILGIKPKEDY